MFERVTLKNFQLHRFLQISFNERITTIVGISDAGKSAILRAIQWVCTNSPSGISFIRKGASRTSVSLKVDGHIIRRVRGKGVNAYYLDGAEFKAFGTGVPTEIAAVLRTSEHSFQGQMDSHFWFSLTAPQVSKELNRLVNLDEIDRAQSKIAKIVREASSRFDLSKKRLKEAKQELESLSFLDRVLKDLERIERCRERIDDKKREAENLRRAIFELRLTEERAGLEIGPALQKADEIDELLRKIEANEDLQNKLRTLIQRTREQEKESCRLKKELARESNRLSKRIGRRCPLCGSEAPSLSSALTST